MALSWEQALNRGVLAGTCASILSTLALLARGRTDSSSAIAPINAVSHWYWGEHATREDRPSLKYTVPGYLTHHATSVFWAVLFEKTFGDALHGRPARTVAASAATAAVACFVDFQLTPKRLTPGFEHRLSKTSLLLVYAAFAAGLAITEMARSKAVVRRDTAQALHPSALRRTRRLQRLAQGGSRARRLNQGAGTLMAWGRTI